MHYPYDAFLRGTGLNIKFMHIGFYTTALNRSIVKWTLSCAKLLSYSFNFSVYITLILLPITVFILLFSLLQSHDKKELDSSIIPLQSVNVEILLPGFNLPVNEIGFYIAALAISSILHELGHAMAAVLEDVPIMGLGFHLWFIIPIAYTQLGPEQMNSLKMWKKLRVLCAGIWNNLLLALFGYLLLSAVPTLLMPFYRIDEAVIVTYVKPKSPVYGLRGFQLNDIITNINACPVYNANTWYSCLYNTIKNQPAYCVTTDFVHQNDESIQTIRKNDGIIQCCDSENIIAACFEYVSDYGELEAPEHMCLNIRKTIEHSNQYCNLNKKCESNLFCIKPQINNATTIIQIKKTDEKDMIYMGHPYDVTSNVKISNYVPKTKLWTPFTADIISTFLNYIVVFSLGLALINVVPCFGLDGQHIISTTINHIFKNRLHMKQREIISLSFTLICSMILFLSLMKTIWVSLAKSLFKN